MTYYPSLNGFFFFDILRLVLLTDWAVHLYEKLIWNQCIWHGLGHTLWFEKKKDDWFSYVLIWSICLRFSWENTVRSALQVATAHRDFSDAATHSSCPTYPGCFLSWDRSILLQGSPQKRGAPRCGNRDTEWFMGRGIRYKPAPNTFNIKTAPGAGTQLSRQNTRQGFSSQYLRWGLVPGTCNPVLGIWGQQDQRFKVILGYTWCIWG